MTSTATRPRTHVCRSRSWRMEKRIKPTNSAKYYKGADGHFDPIIPVSLSAKASPKRAISPEIFNWKSRNGNSIEQCQAHFQILITPKLKSTSPEASDLSPASFSPQPWNSRYSDCNYLSLDDNKQFDSCSDSPLPFSSNTPSGQTSKTGSTGIRTPSWTDSRKLLVNIQGTPISQSTAEPSPTGTASRPDSVLNVVRGAFNKWLDNLRVGGRQTSSNNNGLIKNRIPVGQTEVEQRSPQSAPNTKVRTYPEIPSSPDTLANSPIQPRDTPARAHRQRPTLLLLKTNPPTCQKSVNTMHEVERLALAVAMATAREAEIEASERRRRSTRNAVSLQRQRERSRAELQWRVGEKKFHRSKMETRSSQVTQPHINMTTLVRNSYTNHPCSECRMDPDLVHCDSLTTDRERVFSSQCCWCQNTDLSQPVALTSTREEYFHHVCPSGHRRCLPCTCGSHQHTLSPCQRTSTLPMINETLGRCCRQVASGAHGRLLKAISCPIILTPEETTLGKLALVDNEGMYTPYGV